MRKTETKIIFEKGLPTALFNSLLKINVNVNPYFHRYMMMRKCWEIVPENRPSFSELYTITSKYVEQMAGYLELGFNPFSRKEETTCMEKDEVPSVALQEVP